MIRLVLPLLVVVFPAAQERDITITATKTVVEPGESVTLTWLTEQPEAFISGLGTVPGSGSRSTRITASREFTLVVSTGTGFDVASTYVRVNGSRGGAGIFPDPDVFGQSGRGSVVPVQAKFFTFSDTVYSILQTLNFSVRPFFRPGQTAGLYYTNWKDAPELMRPDDRGIRQRRVAHAVRLAEQAKDQVAYDVITLVEFQRFAEVRWLPETQGNVLDAARAPLRKALENTR